MRSLRLQPACRNELHSALGCGRPVVKRKLTERCRAVCFSKKGPFECCKKVIAGLLRGLSSQIAPDGGDTPVLRIRMRQGAAFGERYGFDAMLPDGELHLSVSVTLHELDQGDAQLVLPYESGDALVWASHLRRGELQHRQRKRSTLNWDGGEHSIVAICSGLPTQDLQIGGVTFAAKPGMTHGGGPIHLFAVARWSEKR